MINFQRKGARRYAKDRRKVYPPRRGNLRRAEPEAVRESDRMPEVHRKRPQVSETVLWWGYKVKLLKFVCSLAGNSYWEVFNFRSQETHLIAVKAH
jgi:hypothetical protein